MGGFKILNNFTPEQAITQQLAARARSLGNVLSEDALEFPNSESLVITAQHSAHQRRPTSAIASDVQHFPTHG
ncbi:MAG: hypothetical protein ACJA0Z_000247 [Halioglobus sp.]